MTYDLVARTLRRLRKDHRNRPTRTVPAASPLRESWTDLLLPGLSRQKQELVLATLRLVETTGAAAYAQSIAASLNFTGRRLLEIGSHYCWYAPFFLSAGGLSYHGADLEFDRGHREISGPGGAAEAPMTFGEFIECFRAVSVTDRDIRDLPRESGRFDAAFMVSTSEHFDDPRGCFAAIAALLAPGSPIFINHHNYYSWNGHHRLPWRVQDIDPGDPRHRAVVDWAHLRRFVRNPDSPNYLNYIRIHDLVDIVSEFFVIDKKTMVRFGPETGEGRLTQAIVDEFPRYYREELETVALHLLARRRSSVQALPHLRDHGREHRCTIEIAWSQRETGNAFITRIPSIGKLDGLMLFEDDRPLGPAGALHDRIRDAGAGAFSVWGNYLYFSTSDNTDPASNGRRYILKSG
jgi:SAM-dependent methyltransferase